MATRKITAKVIAQARASHTGRDGDLFFDDSSNQFFISDGTTAGGAPLVLNTLRNVAAFTASTALTVAQSGSVISGISMHFGTSEYTSGSLADQRRQDLIDAGCKFINMNDLMER